MDSELTTPSWGDSWQAVEARRKAAAAGREEVGQQNRIDICLRQIRPNEFRVLVNGGDPSHSEVTRYLIRPDALDALFRQGYKDGSRMTPEFFESLRSQGRFYRSDGESDSGSAKIPDIAERISGFFQSIEYGLTAPDLEVFRRELLAPIMAMGGGSIRDQHLLQLAARLKAAGERAEGTVFSGLRTLAEELCDQIPAILKTVVDQTLSFRLRHRQNQQTAPEPKRHASSEDDLSKRAVVLDMLKVLELETQNLKQMILESPELIGEDTSLSGHPMAQPEFLSMLESLMSPAHELAAQAPINMAGNGPWRSKLLVELLKKNGIKTGPLTPDTNCVAVGSEDVDVDAMRNWLSSRDGEGVVYPQELLVLFLLTGKDPLPEISEEHAKQWIAHHPVLMELFGPGEVMPPWPSVAEGDDSFDEKQEIIQLLRGESPLAKMGYSVRQAPGFGPKRRRDILRRAFEGKIPRVDPQKGIDAYMAQWGNPGTSQRLWRIARHLAGQINLKRPNQLQARAVGLWREDLDWLHQELYPRIRFRFAWPRIFGG